MKQKTILTTLAASTTLTLFAQKMEKPNLFLFMAEDPNKKENMKDRNDWGLPGYRAS